MDTKLTTALVHAIRADLTVALGEIAQRHGLKQLQLGKITFDPEAGSFGGRIEGLVQGGLSDDARRYEKARQYVQRNQHYPILGTYMPGGTKRLMITGMTRGGKIVLADPAGKQFTLKRATFDRTFPMPRESADKLFSNFRVPAPARKPAGGGQ